MDEACSTESQDLASGNLTLALIWWLPTAAILAAIFLATAGYRV